MSDLILALQVFIEFALFLLDLCLDIVDTLPQVLLKDVSLFNFTCNLSPYESELAFVVLQDLFVVVGHLFEVALLSLVLESETCTHGPSDLRSSRGRRDLFSLELGHA